MNPDGPLSFAALPNDAAVSFALDANLLAVSLKESQENPLDAVSFACLAASSAASSAAPLDADEADLFLTLSFTASSAACFTSSLKLEDVLVPDFVLAALA